MKNKNSNLEVNNTVNKEVKIIFDYSYFDKLQILDDYYLWLFESSLDANQGCVLAKYKEHLKQQFLNEKD